MVAIPRRPQKGQNFEVVVERLDAKGQGEAWLRVAVGPQGQLKRYGVLVRKGLPGDRVRIRVDAIKRGVIEAGVEEVLEPSERRIEPRCRHFGQREEPGRGCGGCTLQSLEYVDQLEVKRGLIARAMKGAGLERLEVAPVLGHVDPWYYRNKMEFSFGTDREDKLSLGLRPAGWRREVLALSECHLSSPFVSGFVPLILGWAERMGLEPYHYGRNAGFLRTLTVREGKRTGERMVELTTTADEIVMSAEGLTSAEGLASSFVKAAHAAAKALGGVLTSIHWTQHVALKKERTRLVTRHLYGKPALHEEMRLPGGHKLRFEINPRAFFQPNTLQAEVLYGEVIKTAKLARGSAARVLDLYCGTGTIGLCLAPYAASVVGVELVEDAVENARHNARINGLGGVTFFAGDAGKLLKSELAGQPFDLVVVDPPRSGLMPEAVAHLSALAPPRLVYVSCNPVALARDLAGLFKAGYTLEGALQPVDLFPHTPHVETIATLVRAEV